MKKAFKLYIPLFLLFGFTVLIAKFAYDFAEQKLYDEALVDHQKQTHQVIHSLIQEQQSASMALALSMAENPIVHQVLQPSAASHRYRKKLSSLVSRINQQEGFENLWVQLIDSDGNSAYRSWTKKQGDSLLSVRDEIREMLIHPESKQVMSVGKFTLSFKSMMPVFGENSQLLGMIEVITQFTPLTQKLMSQKGIGSILLTDKRYQEQLTKAINQQFVEGFYVTNKDVSTELLQLIHRNGLTDLVKLETYRELRNYVINRLELKDKKGGVLAHWLTFTPKEQISFDNVTWVLQKYAVISVGAVLLLLLLVSQFINNRHSERDKRYFRQIIDSVSDIIYITNYRRIVDSNHQFFDFYDEFDTIDGFLKKYNCVCDTFVEDEGFLHKNMDGEYWLDYILHHENETHRAKIMRHGTAHIFQFKVKPMQGQKEQLYNVLMQDVTQVEAYEKQLQNLAVTDELTGVGNRLACNNTLTKEIQRSHRYQTAMSIIMLDIDYFKRVNDNYGHDVGDLVLKEVATVVDSSLRETDKLCRFGGEEFVVVLSESNQQSALQTAERLRKAIKDLSSKDVPTQITISLGVATLTKWDNDKTLIKRADNALYRAKELGRDRVELELEPQKG